MVSVVVLITACPLVTFALPIISSFNVRVTVPSVTGILLLVTLTITGFSGLISSLIIVNVVFINSVGNVSSFTMLFVAVIVDSFVIISFSGLSVFIVESFIFMSVNVYARSP